MHRITGTFDLIGTIRHNQWLHMVSSKEGNAPIKVNQDVNFYSLELEKDKEINFPVKEGRQAYLVQIEGNSDINEIALDTRDGLEIVEEYIQHSSNRNLTLLID